MRALNIPNSLTLLRLFGSPAIPALLFFQINLWGLNFRFIAFALALVLALTDYLDGLFAKLLKQESEYGKMLDPVADFYFCLSLFASVFIIYAQFPILHLAWVIFAAYFAWYSRTVHRLRRSGKIHSPNKDAKLGMGALMISLLAVFVGTFASSPYIWQSTAVIGIIASMILTSDALEEYKKTARCADCSCSQ